MITDFKKKNILDKASLNERLVILSLSSLGLTLIGRKFNPSILRGARNLLVSYVGLGLFLAPEVFNPYIRIWKFKS